MIRTPLEPVSTFEDDPLRIIRCVRFASRYNFELHPDIEAALREESLRKALRERISRERVGIEVEKMFARARAAPVFTLEPSER
jgi:tRNA nucleotidyltransferase (CCA-adding enzyme)